MFRPDGINPLKNNYDDRLISGHERVHEKIVKTMISNTPRQSD